MNMRPDLQGLEITNGELATLTGISFDSTRNRKFNISQIILVFILLSFIWSVIFTLVFKVWGFINLVFSVIAAVASTMQIYTRQQSPKPTKLQKNLQGLLSEVAKHNQIVRDIDTLDQLQAVGNPVALNNREQVIEALKITKEDLVRALNTERILRENPGFNSERFAIDLTNLRALKVSEQAGEYGRLLNEALQIGVSVQQEMKKLQKKR
ncbi:hypothetical protein IQ264_20495 [Phormidium sp. LEGE 05292]|uniref:hypothetical protein n=1 Tax=[Phormidium] sp. LEGE 05292 TaxID=767427 RepID=UPI0018806357|nr:hypothetical protein [Phormidium sp. LEGE 05292]MBE9227806.1 hypothetical protein [Phormidium sp. LEGE 05292]